jgi:hypothetical protein
MVLLHEEHLRAFVDTWREAKRSGVKLPENKDPDYASFDTLLAHLFGASRAYLNWLCEQLELPDPKIEPVPEPELIESRCDQYMEHLLERWLDPLCGVSEDAFAQNFHVESWDAWISIEGMLEHAVMHPIRHQFQLRELIENTHGDRSRT